MWFKKQTKINGNKYSKVEIEKIVNYNQKLKNGLIFSVFTLILEPLISLALFVFKKEVSYLWSLNLVSLVFLLLSGLWFIYRLGGFDHISKFLVNRIRSKKAKYSDDKNKILSIKEMVGIRKANSFLPLIILSSGSSCMVGLTLLIYFI